MNLIIRWGSDVFQMHFNGGIDQFLIDKKERASEQMSTLDVLKLTPLSTHMMTALQANYQVHDHGHLIDPSILSRVSVMIGTSEMKVDAKLLATYPKIRMVCVVGDSFEHIDLNALKAKNIALTSTPDAAWSDVADLAMGLMLSVIRKISEAHRFVRNADWVEGAFPMARQVTGARMGFIGHKPLIKEIAHRAEGFKAVMSYFDPQEDAAFSQATGIRWVPQLMDMVKALDVLVLCAQNDHGMGQLINAQVIDALGVNAYVINVGKADILDQMALLKALQMKKLAGAGIDVFEDEPRVSADWRNLPNAVLTPHMGSSTEGAQKAMAMMALGHLDAFKRQTEDAASESSPNTPSA